MAKDNSTLNSGSCLQNGKYRIHSVLGQGGFGITYLAEQTGLGMKVAIKEFFMRGSCLRDVNTSRVSVPVDDNEELVRRCQKKFKSEARKIASLNNDHIVNIIDVFDENGTSYYVMKYLAGGSLASLVDKTPLPEQAAVRIIGEIADALKSVHSNGLLHLDIKPANILMDERGRAVLIDFGVSKYVDSQQDSSTTSSLVGFSRGFAPLEQVNATLSSLSAASDIYALGATLYNMVTGSAPPEASAVMEAGLPDMPSKISDEVKNAITQAMQPRRTDRPQDVEAFMALLPKEEVNVIPEETVVVVRTPDEEPAPASSGKKNRLFFIVSSIMLAASVILAVVTFLKRPSEPAYDYTDLYEQAQEWDPQVDSLEQANKALTRQVEDLNKQVGNLKSKNSQLQKEAESYKKDAEKWRRQVGHQVGSN